MQRWDCDRYGIFWWWKCETIFNFRYGRFDANFIHIWRGIYLLMMWVMIIFYVDYKYFYVDYYLWHGLRLFPTWIMIIFVVLCVYVMYNLSLNSSGTDIMNRKPPFISWKKVKRLKVRLSGYFYLRKSWVSRIHHLCQAMSRRLKGGTVSIMKRYHLMNNMGGPWLRVLWWRRGR